MSELKKSELKRLHPFFTVPIKSAFLAYFISKLLVTLNAPSMHPTANHIQDIHLSQVFVIIEREELNDFGWLSNPVDNAGRPLQSHSV